MKYIPLALPDELIFSRLCRHLTLSGINRDDYLKSVLGNSRVSINPYLNSDLPRIAMICSESPYELWCSQTLLPLFAYFLPKHRDKICDYALPSTKLVRACQLASLKEHKHTALKFCPACSKEDIKRYGVAYWHRNHQIPGIESCYKHGVWLVYQALPDRPYINAHLLPPYVHNSVTSTKQAWLFAQYANRFLDTLKKDTVNKRCYISELRNLDYITKGGCIRRKALVPDIYRLTCSLGYFDRSLLPTSESDYKYWAKLFIEDESQHPFKHLLLGFWLESAGVRKNIEIPDIKPNRKQSESLEELCCQLLIASTSMAETARRIGKSRSYVKLLALKKGIPVNLKPISVTEDVKRKVIIMAHKGFHRLAIARKFGVSTGSIEMIISTCPELVERRRCCRKESKCRKYKAEIVRFISHNPMAIRKEVKLECNAAFFWLYNNEKNWLEKVLMKPIRNKPFRLSKSEGA